MECEDRLKHQLICFGCIREKECDRSVETVIDCLDTRLGNLNSCEQDIDSIDQKIKDINIALEVIASKLEINLEFEVSLIHKKRS